MLLSFSRLDPLTKRLKLLIDTSWLMPEQEFLIAGNELPGHPFRSERHAMPKNLKVLVRDRFDKASLYRSCEVFLAPYLNEDFGIAPVEAMSFGKPVVTCRDSGGVLETVIHLETGFVTDPSPRGLVEGIGFCLENKEQMADRCVERARQFRWDRFRSELGRKFLGFCPAAQL